MSHSLSLCSDYYERLIEDALNDLIPLNTTLSQLTKMEFQLDVKLPFKYAGVPTDF